MTTRPTSSADTQPVMHAVEEDNGEQAGDGSNSSHYATLTSEGPTIPDAGDW